jgi:hypothetical protein
MKRFLAVLLLCSAASAQWLWQPTWVANPLPARNGKIIQWGIPSGSGAFYPDRQEKKFALNCTSNCIQFQTVNGVTMIHAVDFHDFCKSGCYYDGTFVDLRQELVTEGITKFWRVSGGLTGTWTGPNGIAQQEIPARYYFETFPSFDGTWVPASGGLTVVLQLN